MEKQSYIPKRKNKIRKYQRPEFILLFLTGFLWLAFLFKVFFTTKVNESAENIDLTTSTKTSNNVSSQKAISTPAKSRNRESTQSIKNQDVVKAVRESFEKVNPRKNDQIIRGEISKIITSNPSSEAVSAEIINMLDDSFELKSLNEDYQQALKSE